MEMSNNNSNASGNSAMNSGPAGSGSSKRRFADPEYIAISELLSSIGEVDEHETNPDLARAAAAYLPKRQRASATSDLVLPSSSSGSASHNSRKAKNDRYPENDVSTRDLDLRRPSSSHTTKAQELDYALDGEFGAHGENDDGDDNHSDHSDKSRSLTAAARHTKLTDLEEHVRKLERENLHLKQTLLLGKSGSIIAGRSSMSSREHIQYMLSERTKVVTEMVEQLNASYLSLGDASRVWHKNCRVGVGVREWDAFGQLQTISLWNMIRSVFATIAVDIVELRPHLPDGEMILTKWRIQGEIASPPQLKQVCASEDCPPTMKVALMAIKSSDLTFTVTTYVIFQDQRIAEQHHCWDQVGVFKRLFGGEIPTSVQEILAIR